MNRTGLPELSKPLRDLSFEQKCEKLKFHFFTFLIKIQGPEGFRKIREVVSLHLALFRSKSELEVSSYSHFSD